MKLNLPKIISAHNMTIASFFVITITSWSGLAILPKTEKDNLTPSELVLVITGSFSLIGSCCLAEAKSGDWTLEDEKPDSRTGHCEDDQESSPSDLPVHNQVFVDTSLDERLANIAKDVEEIAQRVEALDNALARQATARADAEAASLAEQEQRAKNNMLTMLSDLGTDCDPLDTLQNAVRLCSDVQLWVEPAKDETRYQDAERFYSEEKIWPTLQDGRIIWTFHPDYDPPDDQIVGNEEPNLKQTSFRPFLCCSRCKYIGKGYSFCAVVPFGCTGDPSEQCREFKGKDSSELKWQFTCDDIPF